MFTLQEVVKYENEIYIFENKDLKDLKPYRSCVTRKNCIKIFNNASELIEIDIGIILAKNQINVQFNNSCDSRNLIINGNYLINFINCSVKIGNKTIQNKQKSFKQSFIISNYIETMKDLNEKLIFDDIVLEQIENIKTINELKFKSNDHYIYGFNVHL